MGGWIAFYLASIINKKILGVIGIATAVDFTFFLERELDEKQKKKFIKTDLYKRLDKELEGTDRVFLKILKNDIKELEPIDNYTEYLTDQMAEYDREAEQNNYSDYDEENIGCQSADDDGKELHF